MEIGITKWNEKVKQKSFPTIASSMSLFSDILYFKANP